MAPAAVSEPDPRMYNDCRVFVQSQARVYQPSIYSHDGIDAYLMMEAILPVHYQGLHDGIGDAVDQTQYTVCFQSYEGATSVLQPHRTY